MAGHATELATAALVCGAVLVGCTGTIGEPKPPRRPSLPSSTCDGFDADRSPDPLRRLSHQEVRVTLRRLLGVEPDLSLLPPDSPGPEASFARQVARGVTYEHVFAMQQVAEAAARHVLADHAARTQLIGCEVPTSACLEAFIARFSRQAWRGQVAADDSERLSALAATASLPDDVWSPYAVVIEAVLQSPRFLFHVEAGEDAETETASGSVRLTDVELATRMSYVLLGGPPSESLLDHAVAGELSNADGVRAAALEMLEDEAALAGWEAFATEWLHLKVLDGATFADPSFTPEVASGMQAEVRRLVGDFFTHDASFSSVLVAPYGYANAHTAALYDGVDGELGDELVRVERPSHRSGLLGSAALLALTSGARATNVVRRGLYVREVFSCDPPPPPPPGVEATSPVDGESALSAAERHLADPTCAGCHQLLDPLGRGLERYGVLGEDRLTDELGTSIALDGEYANQRDGSVVDFSGAAELATLLQPAFSPCLAEKLLTYAYARPPVGREGACAIEQWGEVVASRPIRDVLADLVSSPRFRTRIVPQGEEDP